MPAAVWEEIVAHAREGKPHEVCGIVRGKGLLAHSAVRGQNIAAEKVENYEVDAQTLLLQFAFEDAGDEMVAIYHSHPVSVAYPSATDAWNAHYPECVYLICSLEHDEAPVLRAFRLTAQYEEIDVEALREALPFFETRPRLFAFYQPAGEALSGVQGSGVQGSGAEELGAEGLGVEGRGIAALAGLPQEGPFYLDFLVDEQGAVVGSCLVTVAEHPIVLLGDSPTDAGATRNA
jgi:proteasome lid subunit RPN8/RPN11